MYLGLPECFSGSKRKTMEFLRGKLQGRLQGWFAKALSHGGKEILLKSVALALPVYAMSCFKLPKDTCSKLTSAMTQFWWSTGDNKRKIPWVAWQKLCKPKSEGGLGFHEISKFNQALLGKQAWRIWHHPNSLLAQILKGRYFANNTFLDSGTGSRPSYAWRSILHGRELLQKGLLPSVGDGASIKVWTDNWIFDKSPRPPNYHQNANVDLSLTVDQLFDPILNTWSTSRVRELFAAEDVPLVLNTKFNRGGEDTMIWGFSNNGLYTSRSGYQALEVFQSQLSMSSPSLPPLERLVWLKLWKTKTSPKLRHFLWRVLSGALAVKERLRSRNIPVDVTCPVCSAANESICHLLFTCSFAQEVWRKSMIPIPPAGFSQNSVLLNLHYLISRSEKIRDQENIFKSFPWILWHIWKARNSLCFEQCRFETSLVLSKACDDFTAWSTVQKQPLSQLSAFPLTEQTPSWSKPPPGVVKCNIGSSWLNPQQNSGVAWIARNYLGATLFHSRRSYSTLSSSLENDLMSMKWAIESLRNLRVHRVIFQGSSAELRSALLWPALFPPLQSLIYQLMELLKGFEEWSIEHTSMRGNRPALAIATSVTKDRRYQSYVAKGSPSWLHSLLISEASIC